MNRPLLLLSLSLLCATVSPASETADLASARALFEASRYPEARLAFERLLAADSGNADIHYYLGRLAMERQDTDAAVREFQRAVALAPDNARDHCDLGIAYGRSAEKIGIFGGFGLAQKCLAEFERASDLDPGNVDYRECLFEYYSRAPFIVGGGHKKAVDEAAAIGRLDPRRGHLAYSALYASDRRFDLALAELDDILRDSPRDYESLYQVGRLAVASGQYSGRGLTSLHLCLKLAPPPGAASHSEVQLRIGTICENLGDTEGARAAYKASLEMDPQFTPASDALRNLR